MRAPILLAGLLFTAAIAVFTAQDISTHGVTLPGVLAGLIVLFLFIGLLGALLNPPKK